jgi:hypothetical protein
MPVTIYTLMRTFHLCCFKKWEPEEVCVPLHAAFSVSSTGFVKE